MVLLNNVECFITTANGRLQEYVGPDDMGRSEGGPCSIVYVKSEEGQLFSVNIRLLNIDGIANSIASSISFDGEPMRESWVTGPQRVSSIDGVTFTSGNGGHVKHKFQFSKLNITEDGPKPKENQGKDLCALGEISVQVCRYVSQGPCAVRSYFNKHGPNGVKTLHEKQLKGRDLVHAVSLSAPKPAVAPNRVTGWYIDSNAKPYLTIKFRYRSERALKGLGLIPRTPLPSSSPEPGNNACRSLTGVQAMSREELEAEVLYLRNTSAPGVKKENEVKRERGNSDAIAGPSNLVIKKRKKKPLVIDLTEDSD